MRVPRPVDVRGFRVVTDDRKPKLVVSRASQARAEPPLFGQGIISVIESLFARVNRLMSSAVPTELNPFAQMGAVANTTFTVALATGVGLLFWYSPSVESAYSSLETMRESPYLAELMRSLHRYSSDACMLFVILHAIQTLSARKVGGARWLAWVSGALLLGLLWFDGWTGYWLVWDQRAQQIAAGSANALDHLPIFEEPVSRSFLTNTTLNSLLFFIVFFVHMLLPLAMGIFLWVHIMRLNKSKFFTNKSLSIFVAITLVVVSLVYPATSERPADMSVIPQEMNIDSFYLLPLYLTDRLTGAAIWLTVLFTTVIAFGLPWIAVRGRATPSIVNEKACNGCKQCFLDCPFNAIDLIPRTDGRGENPVIARIDPSKCIGCGICVGSCDSTAIDQSRLPVLDARRWINHAARPEDGSDRRFVAFLCAESAAGSLTVRPDGSSPELPGYHVLPVPCAGYVHMLSVERALRHGAEGVLIVGCASDPACRHGSDITRERLVGAREPSLRTSEHVDRSRVCYLTLDKGGVRELSANAQSFREGTTHRPRRKAQSTTRSLIIAGSLVVTTGAMMLLSAVPYRAPILQTGRLVVSFKHAGAIVESAPEPSSDENLLPHMRGARSPERRRMPVRMGIWLDDSLTTMEEYPPSGLYGDGLSVAVERIDVSPGDHKVTIRISDDGDDDWEYVDTKTVRFETARRCVVLFDRVDAFRWHDG